MEDAELRQRLEALQAEMLEVRKMTRKMYLFFLGTVIATIIAFVLPLIVLFFEIPTFVSTYGQMNSLLN
jgi:hypothetical protein